MRRLGDWATAVQWPAPVGPCYDGRMSNIDVQQTFQTAVGHHRAGQFPQAEGLYRQILERQPNHADTLNRLGVLESQRNRNDIAMELIRRAIAINSAAPSYHINLGRLLQAASRWDEAIACYQRALTLDAKNADTCVELGLAYQGRGQFEQAIAAFRQALHLRPGVPETNVNLGNALLQNGQIDDAIAAYQAALKSRPDSFNGLSNLGTALIQKGDLDGAIACYREALKLRPNSAPTHCNLGSALKDVGRLDEAVAAYRTAVALQPDDPAAYSNLLYALHYHPDYDAKALYQEHLRWGQLHAEPLAKAIGPHHNDPSPTRRLRIGYVSPNFSRHIVGLCLLPLFEQHNHAEFEVFCYADLVRPDETTEKLRSHADVWRNIVGMSDIQVAQQVQADKIDILIDLTLHMAGSRLGVFARKPAPVQVTYLGYPSTTGLTAIDYRLSDHYLDPPGTDDAYTEKTIRLPDTHLCWRWSGPDVPVSPLPAQRNGYITFGCLNNFCKINSQVLTVWGQILSALPGSLLVMRCPQGNAAQMVLKAFAQHGIAPSRIQLVGHVPRDQYVALLQQFDIGLDPFPYSGHTTTCDGLWMGVPVVTLARSTAVSRAGVWVLSNVNLPELVAHSQDDYIAKARGMATDIPRLAGIRASLRQRMLQSPLMDAPRFARDVEAAYRGMWRWWCKTVWEKYHG
jgi:protein O-GlcNAc transferase